MTDQAAAQVNVPPGLLAVTTYGDIRAETTRCLIALTQRIQQLGLPITVNIVPGSLVDKARNEAAMSLLADPKLQWLWFLDADMTFEPQILDRLLTTAFKTHAQAAIVGAYCNLKGAPYLPTIDTGTGTWEVTHPGQGVVPVIRTGGACVLIKRAVFDRLPYPWFGVRTACRPLEAMQELDGFARQLYDNRNPLAALPAWDKLLGIATQRASDDRARNPALRDDLRVSTVGEDSNFCDMTLAATDAGFQIVVDTHAICYHLETRPIGPVEHLAAVQQGKETMAMAVGVLS